MLKKTQSWAYAPMARSFMVAAEDACLRFWSNQLLDVQFGGKACTDQDANVVHDDVRHGKLQSLWGISGYRWIRLRT